MNQLLSIGSCGEITALRIKKAFSFSDLGKEHVERATDIKWDDTQQKWYIQILLGTYVGFCIGDKGNIVPEGGTYLYFVDYDDAVRYEIEFVQKLIAGGDM